MKASKFIVLVGGILGIIAFFLPLASGSRTEGGNEVHVSISAFQVVKGIEAVSEVANSKDVDLAAVELSASARASFEKDKKDLNTALNEVKGIIIGIFVPAFLLALIGGLAVTRKKFGRGAGTLAFLLGIAALGIGAVLKAGLEGDAGFALTLLMVTGAAGIIGGLLALVKPDRGLATA